MAVRFFRSRGEPQPEPEPEPQPEDALQIAGAIVAPSDGPSPVALESEIKEPRKI